MSMESDLMSLFFQIGFLHEECNEENEEVVMPKVASLIIQIIFLFNSMDLDSQPKPELKLISLIKKIISVLRSIKDSGPKWLVLSIGISYIFISVLLSEPNQEPKPELIASVIEVFNKFKSFDWDSDLDSKLRPLIVQLFQLARFGSLDSLISLSPGLEVEFKEEQLRVRGKVQRKSEEKRNCHVNNLKVLSLTGEVPTHFHCEDCNGEYHEECDKAPIEVKHPLHPKHFLQLVTTSLSRSYNITRKCYCCEEYLRGVFYYCSSCDYAMNIACVEKSPVLSIDHPKWHEHTLLLFSRHTSLTCDVCALTHSACPFYICPPCGFVVHHKCTYLPRVIKISRHPHRIYFTPFFNKGDWSCGVCRRKIDNDYGGYSCTKNDCSYAVHSRCATQSNVWDGVDLDGVPEIEEEVLEPFVRISDGIIEHFSHQQHSLRLDENTDRDDRKQCQACMTPVYFGNIYSCTQCDFILHEKCANLSRELHHPIHPHILTLVGGYDGGINYIEGKCSTCYIVCTNGFFYECSKEECARFRLHVQCATISEPLVHESHMHPLFLTSKPNEERRCGVCKGDWAETFNCVEECKFALCYKCATVPHKVRYKHDKHMLTLTYGEETSTMEYWCEVCEKKINLKKRFYSCDDGCCVTLHIGCLIGKDLYMKPNSSFFYHDKEFDVLPNNHHMSRPVCSHCKKRCPHSIVFQYSESITCSIDCTWSYYFTIKK